MIVYSLRCSNEHEFEGWFRDSAAFDHQASGGLLCCPTCNTSRVEKSMMAPALSGVKKHDAAKTRQMRQFVTGLRKYVQEHAEYVGQDFAEEARKIHYGEGVERHIYGETTIEEAADLAEEGVDVAALPPDLDGAN